MAEKYTVTPVTTSTVRGISMALGSPSLPLIIASFVFLSALTGCATVDQKIDLGYATVDRSFGRQSGDIALSRVEPTVPARNVKGEWVVGSLNNAHGVHQADLLSDQSLGEWISDALLLELKQAGYTVTYTASLPANAPRGILITDINGFMNVNKGVVSVDLRHELKFNVDLFLNGVKAKTFTVASRDNQTLPLTASKEKKEKIMLQSLQDTIQQIIPEIIALTGTRK